jgi:fused signal recognition particle receptor
MVFGICSGAKRRGVVLQATEGGSFSVGNRKFKIEASGTPPPLVPAVPAEGTPVAMPAQIPTERIPRRSPLRLSLLAPATDKMVVSRSALIGLCLTAFAGGVVITLAVDRVHASASEAFTHAPDPVLLQPTPIPEPAPRDVPAPTPPATAARALPAADPVVVQLPRDTEKPFPTAPTAPRPMRQVAAAPVHASAARSSASQKKTAALPESAPTEAAPDDQSTDSALPTPIKKKWVDPFAQ